MAAYSARLGILPEASRHPCTLSGPACCLVPRSEQPARLISNNMAGFGIAEFP